MSTGETPFTYPTDRTHRRRDHVVRERTSLSLRADVLTTARQIVASGGAENLSAFVEGAILEKIGRTRRDTLFAAYEAAAADDAYLADMEAVHTDFADTIGDGL
jgi:hypothetical protein